MTRVRIATAVVGQVSCGLDLATPPIMTNYNCPMHPDVISDRPGICSKCGMKLEQIEQRTTTTSARKGKNEPREK